MSVTLPFDFSLLDPRSFQGTAVAFQFGFAIGSALNIVINRLSEVIQQTLDNCTTEYTGQAQLFAGSFGIFSSFKKRTISFRDLMVALTTALLTAIVVWHFGINSTACGAILFTYFLMVLAYLDIDHLVLLDILTLPLLWIGLLFNLEGMFSSLPDAVIGVVTGYLLLWLIYWLCKLTTHKEGIGYGDFKLLAALGAWLGWQGIPVVLILALSLAILFCLITAFTKRCKPVRHISFGPFLALSGYVWLLYGKDFWRFVLSIYF